MTTTIVIDDDVKVWIAAKVVAAEKGDFSASDVGSAAQRLFKADAKKIERFLVDHCVANTEGSGPKHFNYLFKVAQGKYRVFRQGDAVEYSHASAPTTPSVSRVPPEYKPLYAAAPKFPEGLRPAAPAPAGKPSLAGPVHRTTKEHGLPASKSVAKAPEPQSRGLQVLSELDSQTPANLARKTIFDMLFLEFGRIGSQLDAQDKMTFSIQMEGYSGSVHTNSNLTLKMPSGHAVSHPVDLVVDLESPARSLYVDIVEATFRPDDLKAHAFDVMHLRKDAKSRYAVLVFLRTPNGTLQEQAEAIAYPYDFFFGVDANDVKNNSKFYALKAQVLQWIQGKVKPRAGA